MKNLFYLFILSIFFIVISSCDENGTNINNSFQKMKITIYVSHSGDTNDYVKNSEYFFDGDVDGYLTRMLRNSTGNFKYQSTLQQERSNVPLPLSKYGCLIKNIEYSKDSIYYVIIRNEYDNQGYINKIYFDSYSSSNKSLYLIYTRQAEKLVKMQIYSDNVLNKISDFFYDINGLCTVQVDSTIASASVRKTFRRYNDKKELIYSLSGKDST